MPTPRRPASYRAWLLRCWREQGAAAPDGGWRFSLEDPHTGGRRSFGTVAAFFAFLRDHLADPEPDPDPPWGPARPRRRPAGPGPGARSHPGAPGAPGAAAD
jgi:hypothetical protein